MTSPFRNVVDSDYEVLVHIRLRWKKTVVFMEPMESAVGGLDIGDRSAFTTELEVFFGCPFDSTDLDLDTGRLNGQYDVVTCLDVIEHLFNPLHCLLQIKEVLAPGGRLYLSTLRYKPHFLWSPHHFHEMSSRSGRALFDRAGFIILRQITITTLPWWRYFTGVRTLLRGLLIRTWLFELRADS